MYTFQTTIYNVTTIPTWQVSENPTTLTDMKCWFKSKQI